MEYFHLDPRRFPSQTKDLLPVDLILQQGLLPLGVKNAGGLFGARKLLNVGSLDTRRSKESVQSLLLGLGIRFDGVQLFALAPPEFVRVLESVYGVSPQALRARGETGLAAPLCRFLEETPSLPG